MTIGAIIVNYHTEQLLTPLLDALLATPSVSEVVIVDNGSTSPLPFASHPRVSVINPGCNIGFGAAVNQAFEVLATDYLLLVNPDLRLDGRSIDRLLDVAQTHRCPMVAPRFYWDDEQIFRLPPATGLLRWLEVGAGAPDSLDGQLRTYYWAEHHDRYWAKEHPFSVPFVSGACLLLQRQWLERSGRVFDERYFMYYEDTDLCLEAHRHGVWPICVPGAEMVHYWSQSPVTGMETGRMMEDSYRALAEKWCLTSSPEAPPGFGLAVDPGPISVDLGSLRDPPMLRLPESDQPGLLEIAVDAGFVPFAQACRHAAAHGQVRLGWFASLKSRWTGGDDLPSERDVWRFPETVWRRLKAGTYYARLRAPDGIVQARWHWRCQL